MGSILLVAALLAPFVQWLALAEAAGVIHLLAAQNTSEFGRSGNAWHHLCYLAFDLVNLLSDLRLGTAHLLKPV